MPPPERIVELNPRHPFVKAMNDLFKTDPSSSKLIDSAKILTDLATMAEGSRVEDPTLLVKRVVSMMEAGLRS
jgi:molecular chaperone HtpG